MSARGKNRSARPLCLESILSIPHYRVADTAQKSQGDIYQWPRDEQGGRGGRGFTPWSASNELRRSLGSPGCRWAHEPDFGGKISLGCRVGVHPLVRVVVVASEVPASGLTATTFLCARARVLRRLLPQHSGNTLPVRAYFADTAMILLRSSSIADRSRGRCRLASKTVLVRSMHSLTTTVPKMFITPVLLFGCFLDATRSTRLCL